MANSDRDIIYFSNDSQKVANAHATTQLFSGWCILTDKQAQNLLEESALQMKVDLERKVLLNPDRTKAGILGRVAQPYDSHQSNKETTKKDTGAKKRPSKLDWQTALSNDQDEVSLKEIGTSMLRGIRGQLRALPVLQPYKSTPLAICFLFSIVLSSLGPITRIYYFGAADFFDASDTMKHFFQILLIITTFWYLYILFIFLFSHYFERRRQLILMEAMGLLICPAMAESEFTRALRALNQRFPRHGHGDCLLDISLEDNVVLWFQLRKTLLNLGQLFRLRTNVYSGLTLSLIVVSSMWMMALVLFPRISVADGIDSRVYRQEMQQMVFLVCFLFFYSLFTIGVIIVLLLCGDATNAENLKHRGYLVKTQRRLLYQRLELMRQNKQQQVHHALMQDALISKVVTALELLDKVHPITVFKLRASSNLVVGAVVGFIYTLGLGARVLTYSGK